MKLKRLKFKNNKIFGDLDIDFTNDKGQPLDTIILAGENGCGKTSLLNAIFEVRGLKIENMEPDEERVYNYILEGVEIDIMKSAFPDFHNEVEISYSHSKSAYAGLDKFCYNTMVTSGNVQWIDVSKIEILNVQQRVKELFCFIYSTVEINYNSSNITSITSKDIDENIFAQNRYGEKSNSEIGTDIKQLFVDIQSNDANDLLQWVHQHSTEVPTDEVKDIRMSRFKRAFDFMFSNIQYRGIETINGHKEVYFQKEGKLVSIDQLSSGEKQVVFRGSFLLKNSQIHMGHIVLIDEPEISLHPNWQKKILGYYKKLFTDNEGNQTSQLFIATHSPFILDSDYRYNDKVIILKNDKNVIKTVDKAKFYTSGEIEEIKDAFNIEYFNNSSQTYILTEGETDEIYIKEYFKMRNIDNYIVQWVGQSTDKKAKNTGYLALDHFRNFMLANPNIVKSNIILLYDCDTKKQNIGNENLKQRCLPFNDENDLYKKGIENLLTIPEDFPKEAFYSKKTSVDSYGASREIQELNKMKLCKYICSLPSCKKEYFFNKFQVITDLIK